MPLSTGRSAQRHAEFSAADPQDVVQDALVRARRKWDQFDERRGSPSAWLLAITADQARAARRSLVRRARVVDEVAALPERGLLEDGQVRGRTG